MLALAFDSRPLQRQRQRDLFALRQFAGLHFKFVDLTTARDLALLDFQLVVDARLGEVAVLKKPRLPDFLARRQPRIRLRMDEGRYRRRITGKAQFLNQSDAFALTACTILNALLFQLHNIKDVTIR